MQNAAASDLLGHEHEQNPYAREPASCVTHASYVYYSGDSRRDISIILGPRVVRPPIG